MKNSPSHFEGKDAAEHLKEARKRGKIASSEIHGAETPGHLAAGVDTVRDLSIILMILSLIFNSLEMTKEKTFLFLLLFSLSYLIWKIGRSALLGWSRLERLHRLIEEERYEIEHHRNQEREELTEIYRMKGLKGQLLDETIDTFMADDNRLLQIMLEEELGLSLEAFEHPLKQAVGAAIGALIASGSILLGFFSNPSYGPFIPAVILILLSSYLLAKFEKNRVLHACIWSLATASLTVGIAYFLVKIF